MTTQIRRSGSSPAQPPGSARRLFWRSLEERADPGSVASLGSDVVRGIVSSDELLQLDRRRFLTLSGAIGALAGVEGCIRRPVEKIMPYTDAPEGVNPGVPNHYATTVSRRGESLGLLITSHEGRPTKVEGNTDSPASLGATDLWAQASILDLYDADRAREPSRGTVPRSFAEWDAFLAGRVEALAKAGGQGLRVLAQPTDSPTFLGLRERVLARFPQAGFHTYAPSTDANGVAGARLAFGEPLQADPRFESAKVILSLDSDFLMTETGSVVAARRFASGRRMESSVDAMSRLYVVEPVLSVTGANADHRLPLAGRAVGRYAAALAAELVKSHNLDLGAVGTSVASAPKNGIPDAWLTTVARDLVEHRGACLVVAGARQPPAVHALAHALNRALGGSGKTVAYLPVHDAGARDPFEDIRTLASDMAAGRVDTLIILGGNPVYDAPADLGFAAALKKVPHSVHVSGYFDETSEHCAWHVPRAHELETWGDHLGRWGYYAAQQPLIAPLWGGRSDIEVLGQLAGESNWRGHELVRATARSRGVAKDDAAWNALLQLGVDQGQGGPVSGSPMLRDAEIAAAVPSLFEDAGAAGNLEAVFVADNKMLDGSSANNAWLLEMPDPITRIVWDNAALIAPSTARELGVASGDLVALTLGGATVEIAAWVQPGQAPGTVGLPLGWGRRRAGSHGNGKGFDVYPLRTSSAPHFASGLKLERRGTTYRFSQTQEHDRMEERPIAIERTASDYAKEPNFGQMDSPDPSVGPLWKTVDYTKGHQWGMTIDLNSCIGCNACILACQSENNIPTVGKIQVGRGREMHWLRIDRYYLGDEDNPDVAFQPVACQQCEEAPCENVCPVSATSHSPEGLNDMAYNRCIGTRYCANNCPYKVRRFNFFNYNLEIPESRKMQYNPSVSIRFRGVMEKCTYCVQRIEGAKIAARREDRAMRDGDIRTACQQACPAQAIVFGDINDAESAVSKARRTDRNYALLAEIGTRPRTRYLGKVRNPNPEMPS